MPSNSRAAAICWRCRLFGALTVFAICPPRNASIAPPPPPSPPHPPSPFAHLLSGWQGGAHRAGDGFEAPLAKSRSRDSILKDAILWRRGAGAEYHGMEACECIREHARGGGGGGRGRGGEGGRAGGSSNPSISSCSRGGQGSGGGRKIGGRKIGGRHDASTRCRSGDDADTSGVRDNLASRRSPPPCGRDGCGRDPPGRDDTP